MKKNLGKTLILLFFLFFSFNCVFAQTLEIDYLTIFGLKIDSITTDIASYFKYIFNFIIFISGLIALGILVFSGIEFLTSTGKPKNIEEAKKRITGAFLGIVILFASYLILKTINPQLVNLNLINLPTPSPTDLPTLPNSSMPSPDLLGRIEALAEAIKNTPDKLQNETTTLISLTNQCDCKNTQPLCQCSGGDISAKCEAQWCYTGLGFHPCPNHQKIQEIQKTIVDLRDLFVYYKSRVTSERDDLIKNIEKFVQKKIDYYQELQKKEDLTDYEKNEIKETLQRLETEKSYKQELVQKLNDLANSILKIKEPGTKIPEFASQCFSNIKIKCIPSCKTGPTYSCHNTSEGCQPDKCSGGNPCPVQEIQSQSNEINSASGEILRICQEIIIIINNIKK